MKPQVLIFLITILLLSAKTVTAQTVSFRDFEDHIQRSFAPSESVQRFCSWQYAIIKVHMDKSKMITGYTLLHPVAKGMDSSFTGLKGYKFNKRLPIRRPNLIFALSIDNMRTEPRDCDTVIQKPHLTALQELKKFKTAYKQKDAYFLMKEIVVGIFEISR